MMNILRSDLYKMVRMKSLYVFTIITTAFNLLISCILSDDSMDLTISVSMLLPLFSGLFICIFAASEYKHGFIKNIAGNVPNKTYIVFSKLIVSLIFVVYIMLVHLVTSFLFGALFNVTLSESAADVLIFASYSALILFALSTLSLVLVYFSGSNAFACTFTVLIASGTISSSINMVLMLLIHYKIIPKYDYSNVFLTFLLTYFETDKIISYVVPLIYIVAAITVSCLLIKKKDVR